MYTYGWTGLTYTPAHRNIGVDSDASFAYIEECESLTRTIIRINNLMKKKNPALGIGPKPAIVDLTLPKVAPKVNNTQKNTTADSSQCRFRYCTNTPKSFMGYLSIYQDRVRFVCISDTHNRHKSLHVPDGDVLIHAGDISLKGSVPEIEVSAH